MKYLNYVIYLIACALLVTCGVGAVMLKSEKDSSEFYHSKMVELDSMLLGMDNVITEYSDLVSDNCSTVLDTDADYNYAYGKLVSSYDGIIENYTEHLEILADFK